MQPYDKRGHLFIVGTEHYEFTAKNVIGGVLDVGCGKGALIPYLQNVDYVGIDATMFAVDGANDSRISFCDVMEYEGQADTICILGVLDTCRDIKPLADKVISLARKRVIGTFHEGVNHPKTVSEFVKHTKNEIVNAFGNVEFYKANTTKETYFMKDII